MTRDDLIEQFTALAAIAEALDQRREIWRVIVTGDGQEVRRVYRGGFIDQPRDRESHSEREKHHDIPTTIS